MHLPIKRVSKDNIKSVFSFQLLFPSELQGSGSPITVCIDPGFINLVQQRVAQLYVLLVSFYSQHQSPAQEDRAG